MSFLDSLGGGSAKFIVFDGKAAQYKVRGVEQPLNGEQFIAHPDGAVGGYIKFNGKETQPERRMGSVFPKDLAPARDSLGDTDAGAWPDGKFSGEPEDPWRPRLEIPLEHAETGEEYIIVGMSKTSLAALKDFLNRCQKLSPGFAPRVRFDVATFKSKFGPVKKPLLTITGKMELPSNGHAKDFPFDDSAELQN
jgi:hypothetical protein